MKHSVPPSPRISINRLKVGGQRLSSAVSTFRSRANSVEALILEVSSAFNPNSKVIQLWHQLLLLCLLYEMMVIPFLLTFKSSADKWLTSELLVVYGCEVLFVVDVYVELNTGYYEDGNVLRDAKKSRLKYIKSARFALDMAALPPLSLVATNLDFSPVFLELHKMIRIWRIPKYIAMLDDVYAKHFELLKMFKVFVVTVLLSHFVACVRFSFGFDRDGHNHWLPHYPHHELTSQSKYLMSLYWAFGLLTGLFEGELPYSAVEFIFTIFVALCGFSLFTYLCATFFMISKCESGHTETAEARINQFKHLLSFHHVPEQLQQQAVGYLKRYYTYTESNDREAMRLLCPSISKDIQVALLKDMVAKIVFFQDCNEQFIIAITSLLEMISLPANVAVFHAGDLGDAMYVVNSGVLHVIVDGVKVREVRKGNFFGEMAMFLNRPRFATVVTTTYCTLYKLVRFHMERVLEGYPEYTTLIPAKVEEMASVIFGRPKRPSTSSPAANKEQEAAKLGKKSIANTLRKHIKLKENRVTPSLDAITAAALAVSNAGRSGYGPKVQPTPSESRKKSASKTSPAAQVSPMVEHIQKAEAMRPSLHKQSSARARLVNAVQEFYAHGERSGHLVQSKQAYRWWSCLLLRRGIDNESKRRMWWVFLLQLNLLYNWLLIPLQLSFELLDQSSWYTMLINTVADLVLWADLYVNFNLTYVQDSEKIWDTTKAAQKYMKSWFILDLVSLLPYNLFFSSGHHATTRIPRLLRALRMKTHFREVDERLQLKSKQRLFLFGVLLTMMYHIIACLYFSITYLEGFSPKDDAWLPTDDIALHRFNSTHYIDTKDVVYAIDSAEVRSVGITQYFRALYYAANVLTALGRAIEPDSDTQYAAALLFNLSGFFITAIVVDNVQKRFTASAFEQKEFFAARSRIQLFLRRQNAPLAIHKRVNAFLDFWWSSHRGAVIGELLEELPETIKRDIIKSICKPALQTLALLNGARPVLEELEQVFVDNVKFILYGQGEIVYRQGDYASGLFFLLEGEVCVIVNGSSPRSVSQGGFFGTAALRLDDSSANYCERVAAISGCILLFVSREHLHAMQATFSTITDALRTLEKRLLDPKLAKASALDTGNSMLMIERNPIIDKVFGVCLDIVFDPDSILILAWETYVFIVMTAQWAIVMFNICFGVHPEHYAVADTFTTLVEVSFLLDIFIRSHLGYYEFGNKVMNSLQIKKQYFRSREFVVDGLALLPLFLLNWAIDQETRRWELLNVNKLIRLFKVPTQFTALENKYLKFTLELRLFKLVYYTFLLSHTFGCIWFDFASHASGVRELVGVAHQSDVSFGETKWHPPEFLEHGTLGLQYFASLFWSFGLMSASSPGELPKTVSQSLFSVVTMTFGFFLFAYVVGNFLDIIELMDAENREFYAKMSSLRHLMSHFQLPVPIQEKFKAYFFFKRYHSITQEYLLERCLPPSLLADIRMVHLQPMIMKVSFLSDMEGSVTRMLVSQFSQVLIVKDEFVYKYDEEGSDMYFVFTGILETLLPRDEFLRGSVINGNSSGLFSGNADRPAIAPIIAHTNGVPSSPLGPNAGGMPSNQPLTKLNQIGAGSYFGENALFFNSVRNAYVRAKSSCILYKLSRNSLELVFNRYPDWKLRVLRMMKVQQEQHRLNRIAFEERQNVALGTAMAQVDHLNAQAEKKEEDLLLNRRMRANTISLRRKQSNARVLSLPVPQESGRQTGSRIRVPKALRILFDGAPAQSQHHLVWLKVIAFTTIFTSIVVPYRIAFDSLERASWLPIFSREMEAVCELLFLADIWVNWRIRGSKESMDLYEQDHRQEYTKERLFWDVLAAFPIDYLSSAFTPSPWCRINRCFKLRNFMYYMSELTRRSIYNEMHRLRTTALLYILIIYWSACTYFAIAVYDRFGDEWQAWLPEQILEISTSQEPSTGKMTLRLLRGLFFATTAFVKKCRTFIPDSTLHFVFAIITCFIGLLIMAFMIGEIASLFISYIGNEVEYRKNHIAVELYLGRWKISGELKTRTQAFLSSLWSSHRGVDYQSLLEEVPSSIRTESILNIANWPLRYFASDVFRPIYRTENTASIDSLMQSIAQRLRFEGYPRGENVLVEGSIAQSMYFVVRGQLYSTSHAQPQMYRGMRFGRGDYFGEKGILGYSVGVYSVRTLRACDLLSLSSEALLKVLYSHPLFTIALGFADQAVQSIRVHPDISTQDTEMRWGRAVAEVIRKKREECDAEVSEPSLALANKKLGAMIDTRFALKTAEAAFGAFRPLLELVVPNGMLASYGVTQMMSTFSRAGSQTPSVSPSGAERKSGLAVAVSMTTMASIGPNGVKRESVATAVEPELTRPSSAEKSGNQQKDVRDEGTESLLISASAKMKPNMLSALECSLLGSSTFRESTRLLRSTTPTAISTVAPGLGRQSLISSAMHRLSDNASTLVTRVTYNRSSESGMSLAAQVEHAAARQRQGLDEMALEPPLQANSFPGMTPSPTPSQLPPPVLQ